MVNNVPMGAVQARARSKWFSAIPVVLGLCAVAYLVSQSMYQFVVRTARISDPARAEVLHLKALSSKRYTDTLHVRIVGEIDGEAAIQYRGSESEPYISIPAPVIGPGKVDVHFGSDWYVNDCFISYQPKNVHSGHLSIRYQFKQ